MTTYNAFFDANGQLALVTPKPGTTMDDGPTFAGVSPADPSQKFTGYEIDLSDDMLREDQAGNLADVITRLVDERRDSLAPAHLLSA